MQDHEIIVENRQIRTRGLAERGVCYIVINDVAPELESVGIELLRPADVLRAVDLFWRCYHSWGAASVIARDTDAELTLSDGVGNALLCASTAGLLTGVVARAGGLAVNVEHGACIADGADRCAFRLTWHEPPESLVGR